MMNDSAKNNHTETNDGKDQDVLAEDIDAYFKNELIYHRNERMAKRVNDLLKENPDQSFFFAFGAGWLCFFVSCVNKLVLKTCTSLCCSVCATREDKHKPYFG